MKKPSYGWLLKWILAAILIGVGTTMFFNKELVFLVTGLSIVLFSLFRVMPLVKSLKKEVLRTLNIIEVLLDFILGGLMIYAGADALASGGSLNDVWSFIYKYTLVFVFIARSLVFFYSVTFLDEKTEQTKFWAHVVVFMLGSMIITIENFNEEWVAWLLLIISILGGGYLIYDGYKGYGNYRRYSLELNQEKQKEVDAHVEKKLPTRDEPIAEKDDQDRPYIS